VSQAPDPVRLTSYSHGAGCACKISAADLRPLIDLLPEATDPNLLVGPRTSDDAAVYKLRDDLAIVVTADFFTPIVDDPYDFGRIATANALSDIYAMGATPVLALNLVAFSLEELGHEVLAEILRGGAEIAREAGVVVAGGHSIDDREPKYGMAVVGIVHPEQMLTNAGARPGDLLYLTKPLGVGLITTAAKRGLTTDATVTRAIGAMTTLNASAATAAMEAGALAATDVTGFGLLGHLHELCEASGVSAKIDSDAVPAIEGALALASDERCVSSGTRRNAVDAESFARFDRRVSAERRVLVSDAMTSGGLLLALRPDSRHRAPGALIGAVGSGKPVIRVT